MDPSSEALEYTYDKHERYFNHDKHEVLDVDVELIEEEDRIPKHTWLTPPIINAFSGTIAGLAGVIAGHPFDTVKVRLQNQPKSNSVYTGTLQTFSKIIKEESVLGLFKGMSSPLVGVAVINAFLFGVYGFLLDVQQRVLGGSKSDPTVYQIFWAGAGSGFVNSIISGPTELAKIQLQVQKDDRFRSKGLQSEHIKGPVDCLKRIYKIDGARGCLRGMRATILRETPSYGVYFASFEAMQRKFFQNTPQDDSGRLEKSMKLLLAGGLSGVFGWLSTYPIDVIKTRIQAQSISHNDKEKQYAGIIDCAQRLVKAEGQGALWKGLGATIIRAFPTNAVIFLAYSTTIDLLYKYNYPNEDDE